MIIPKTICIFFLTSAYALVTFRPTGRNRPFISQLKLQSKRSKNDNNFERRIGRIENRDSLTFRSGSDTKFRMTANELDYDIKNELDHDIKNELDHDIKNEEELQIDNWVADSLIFRNGLDTKSRMTASELDYDIKNELDYDIKNELDYDIKNELDYDIKNELDYDIKKEEELQIDIWVARGILLVVAILWGTNFASVKYLETLCFNPPCDHLPSEAAVARFGVAAIVSAPLLIGQRLDVIKGGFECGIWIALGYISQAMALETIPSGKCAFICSLTVVVVPLLSSLFGKRIKPVNIICAIIALIGVGILEGMIDVTNLSNILSSTTSESSVESFNSGTSSSMITDTSGGGFLATMAETLGVTKGDILALGQPLGFGLSFMRIEHYVEKFENVPNRVLTIAAAECIAVGMCSLFWVLYDFHGTIPNLEYLLEWHRIVAILWTGVVTTVIAIYFEGFALQVASASDASLTFASEPVWASIFGAWLLHEELNLTLYIGGSIILFACFLGAAADLSSETKETNKIGAGL